MTGPMNRSGSGSRRQAAASIRWTSSFFHVPRSIVGPLDQPGGTRSQNSERPLGNPHSRSCFAAVVSPGFKSVKHSGFRIGSKGTPGKFSRLPATVIDGE